MWVSVSKIFVYYSFMLFAEIMLVRCHLPSYIPTPSNKVEQSCTLSETCVHDTIPVCGKMNDEKRTFLDLCDMLEYACDTNQVYTHVDDMADCPVFKS